MEDITDLLQRWSNQGDQDAFDRAVQLLYQDLKRVAANRHRGFPDDGFSTTELVNQAFVSLLPSRDKLTVHNRRHFINLVSVAIQRFLCDEARRLKSVKRGANPVVIELESAPEPGHLEEIEQELAIQNVFAELKDKDDQLFWVMQCRHLLGMSMDETARELHISTATVSRKWAFGKAWLGRALQSGQLPDTVDESLISTDS